MFSLEGLYRIEQHETRESHRQSLRWLKGFTPGDSMNSGGRRRCPIFVFRREPPAYYRNTRCYSTPLVSTGRGKPQRKIAPSMVNTVRTDRMSGDFVVCALYLISRRPTYRSSVIPCPGTQTSAPTTSLALAMRSKRADFKSSHPQFKATFQSASCTRISKGEEPWILGSVAFGAGVLC